MTTIRKMSILASQNKDLKDNQVLVRIFFRTIDDPKKKGRRKVENNLEGKAFCLRCEEWYQDNSGHGNLHSHIFRSHLDWQVLLNSTISYSK